jgi:protein-tyrosine phosphatase
MCLDKTTVLFVCMGNICRSPTAECFFRSAIEEAGKAHQFDVESAGTGGWHAGDEPDLRMQASANKRGMSIEGSARQITQNDIASFDWIFCMDQDNYDGVIAMGGDPKNTKLLLPFVGHHRLCEVPDPYYGGEKGFDDVITLINDAVKKLATMLG